MRDRGDEDMPLSVILAIMPGTRLRIRPFGGEWTVVDGLPIDDFSRAKMTATANELSEELALARRLL